MQQWYTHINRHVFILDEEQRRKEKNTRHVNSQSMQELLTTDSGDELKKTMSSKSISNKKGKCKNLDEWENKYHKQ